MEQAANPDKPKIIGLHAGLLVLYAGLIYFYYRVTGQMEAGAVNPVGGDFVNIWTAARMVLQGQADRVYDFHAFYQAQQELFGAAIGERTFPYVPFFLPFILPLGLMPYGLALGVWTIGTFALFAWALRGFDKTGTGVILLLALAPACAINIFSGQNGFLSAALFIGGLGLLKNDRRVLAGVMFGLLTFKPHLGLLIPLALLAGREWKTFLAAGLTAASLIVMGLLLFGFDMYESFVNALGAQAAIMRTGEGMFLMMMPSAFAAVRILDGPLVAGFILTAIMALAAVGSVWWAWRKTNNADLRAALLLCAALMAVPYVLNYDMTLLAAAVILLYPYARDRMEKIILLLLWIGPLLLMLLNFASIPIGPLVLAGGLYLALRLALIPRR